MKYILAMSDIDNKEYLRWLVENQEALSNAYKPITSKETRKTGKQLIATSLILFIITFNVFTLQNISIYGNSVELVSNQKPLLILGTIICLYLLLTYSVDLFTDWSHSKTFNFDELKKHIEDDFVRFAEQTKDITKSERKASESLKREGELISQDFTTFSYEMDKLIENIYRLKQEKNETFPDEIINSYYKLSEELEKLKIAKDNFEKRVKNTEDRRINFLRESKTQTTRFELIVDTIKKTKSLENFRYWLEVIIPLSLAMSSIMAASTKLLTFYLTP